MLSEGPDPNSASAKQHFATTQWSLVLAAADLNCQGARDALAQLCETYWYPVYAYVRRHVSTLHEAEDLTQEFFTQLIEKNTISVAEPKRGRFRAFLLTSLKNFLANQRQKAKAQKRGGGKAALPIDFSCGESRFAVQPSTETTPERLFDKEWTIGLLDQVVNRLHEQYVARGKAQTFDTLKVAITAGEKSIDYQQAARILGISKNAAEVAASRLRKQYRELLRREISQTVEDPGEIEDEIQLLIAILSAK